MLRYSKKGSVLTLTATLCYKFDPKRNSVLSYCPLHIAFNFGNSMNHDDPKKNAEEYATQRVAEDEDRMAIKSGVGALSSKMFSNVQKMSLNMSRDEIEKIQNQLSIIFRCSGRDWLVGQSYPFSFVLTIEQKHSAELDGHSLYDGLELVNDVEVIAQAALEAEA